MIDIVQDILEVEKAAEEIVNKAKLEAEELRARTERDASELIAKTRENARKSIQQHIEETRKRAESEMRRLIESETQEYEDFPVTYAEEVSQLADEIVSLVISTGIEP